MTNLKHTIITIALAVGAMGSAYALPAYPMSFYGNVNIDDAAAPVGTIIRAYDASSTLLGEVTVVVAGVYGYDNPTKQRLVLKETSGAITFKFKTDSKNSGIETAGTVSQDYANYAAGQTIKKDLSFKSVAAAPAGSGGGGGGGGGGSYVAPVVVMQKPATGTNATTSINKTEVVKADTKNQNTSANNMSATNQANTKDVVFTKNLSLGTKSNDVLAMQKILIQQKLLPTNAATGYFGPATQKAVKDWQKKNKIQVTGTLGPVSRSLMMKQAKK